MTVTCVCYSDTEQQLPTDKLHALCGMMAVQQYVRQTDYVFYQTIVGILVPDVLRPIPSQWLCFYMIDKIFNI